jgi:hypothetical protein
MTQCEHLYTHIIQLFISPRGKVVLPPYGKLNKEGVIKLSATSLSPSLYIQILAQDLSEILGLLMALKWIECSSCGFFQYLSGTREYYARSYNLFLFLLRFCFLHFFLLLNFVSTVSVFSLYPSIRPLIAEKRWKAPRFLQLLVKWRPMTSIALRSVESE